MRARRFPPLRVGGELKGVVVVLPLGRPDRGGAGDLRPGAAGRRRVAARRRHARRDVLRPRAGQAAPGLARTGRRGAWRRRHDGACAGRRRRRDRRAVGGVQPDGRRAGGAARRAAAGRSRAASVAGRRLARADDAAHRDSRLPRNAEHAGRGPRRGARANATSASSPKRRCAWKPSSATCSTWRGSKAAAREIEAAEVPVSWLFERVAERHGVVTGQRGITMTTTIEPGAEQVRGDGRRLEQALQNLVANAVRHTPDGGRVAVTASRVDGRRAAARRGHRPGHSARAPAAGVRPLLQDRSGPRRPARPAAAWASPSSRPSSNGTADAWRRRRPPAAAHDSTSFCRHDEVKPRACPTRSRPCFSLRRHGRGGRGPGLPRC